MWPDPKMKNQRFYKCNETEIESLIDKTKNHNTKASTKTWVNVNISLAPQQPSHPKRQRIESLSDFDSRVDLNLFSELL